MEGVQARLELDLQSVVHGPMLRQPGEAFESRRTNLYGIMRFAARRCPSMTVVQMRLIHYIKLGRGKRCDKCGSHALYAGSQFLRH